MRLHCLTRVCSPPCPLFADPDDLRDPSNDRNSILITVLTVLGVIIGVICCERLYSSCRRTIKRRQGREGFQVMDINPDIGDEQLELGNIRGREGEDHL